MKPHLIFSYILSFFFFFTFIRLQLGQATNMTWSRLGKDQNWVKVITCNICAVKCLKKTRYFLVIICCIGYLIHPKCFQQCSNPEKFVGSLEVIELCISSFVTRTSKETSDMSQSAEENIREHHET